MPLVHMGDMLRHARQYHYAVAAFAITDLASLKAVMAAAEQHQAPVILTVNESRMDEFVLEPLITALHRAAQRARVPVVVQLEAGTTIASAVRAINLGCTAVSLDSSKLSQEENRLRSRELVEIAHACGIPVQGRVDAIPGHESVTEAGTYCETTGVDSIALVTRLDGDIRDIRDHISTINDALHLPLALDAGDDMDHELLNTLVENGVARINLSETRCARAEPWLVQTGSAGKAAELLDACRPWRPVEHVILYNTEGLDEEGINLMMAEGRRVLSKIPGVLEVFTGHAVQENANYRHCWVVRFTDRAVIDIYRDHPEHQRFADELFRPHAGGRTSIDYEDSSV